MIPVFFYGRACRSGRSERTLLAIRPDLLPARLAGFRHTLTIVDYTELGRDQEAREEAAELLRIYPQFSLEALLKRSAQRDEKYQELVRNDCRKAGLK